jgi:phage repressor protein C with HTH and peptisase S24 domain
MREHEIATHDRLKVSSSLSRILSHAPEWRRLRQRGEKGQGSRVAKEPSFFTIVNAANELKVPICTLVPTIEHQPLTPLQRKFLTLAGRWMLGNFAEHDEERGAYRSDFDDFEAYATVEKLTVESAASKTGADDQLPPETVDVLASIPGIRKEQMQVTTVRGESMAERLRPGDRIVVDTYRRMPRTGDMIVVDLGHLGRAIGYWRREGKRCFLDKENEPTIDLGSPGEVTILGTVEGIVWRNERRSR